MHLPGAVSLNSYADYKVFSNLYRLVLLMQISSISTKVIFPIPLLASASAVHDPTPPTPMIQTCADLNTARAPSP